MKKFIIIFISNFIFASELILSISSNPNRINPILANDSASSEISSWLFEGLFRYNKDGKIVKNLIEKYYWINKTTLFVKLKNNVYWTDGVKLSSDDVIFTYKSIISDSVYTPLRSDFEIIKKIEKIDNLSLKIYYKKPFFKALHIWLVGLLPKHLLENEDLMKTKFNTNPIGLGSYILEKFEFSKDIKLKANKNYFIHKPYIDKIIYKFIPDSNTEFLMLKKHKLDIGSLSPIQVSRQIDNKFKKYYKIIRKQSYSYTYLGFNLKNKKFNKDIRKAINLAIDKKQLVDILFFGYAKVCNGPFLPGSFAYVDIKHKYNLKKAKEILKKYGYTKDNPLKFTLTTNANNKLRVYTAEILQYQLKKANIEVKIKVLEWQAFLNTIVFPRNFEAVLLGWGLSLLPDAKSIWHSKSSKKGGFNFISYSNKEVDRLIEIAQSTTDIKKYAKIYKKIFKLIANDYPYVFLYIPDSIVVVNKKIKNIKPSLIGIMYNQIDWIKE